MTIRLSPILKYQLAIDIHVISTLGGAAAAGTAHDAASASVARTANLDFMRASRPLVGHILVAPMRQSNTALPGHGTQALLTRQQWRARVFFVRSNVSRVERMLSRLQVITACAMVWLAPLTVR